MYYSAAVVGLNTSAFLDAAVVGKPAQTVLLDDVSTHNQEGTIHFHYLLDVNGGLLRAARSFPEHVVAAGRLARRRRRRRRKADASSRRSSVRHGRTVAATPRFVDAIEEVGRQPAPAAAPSPASDLAAATVAVSACRLHCGCCSRRSPGASRPGLKIRKTWQDGRRQTFVKLKQFAQSQLGEKEFAPPPPAASSALTPKPGRPRDPAKKLAGWNLPEAEEARELITMLGRSGRPIIVGPWLSETGFELLYWIPFLAWAKAYGNFDPSQLIIVSRGGAASWYRHISSNYEDILSFYTPDEFRRRNEERIVEQRGRLKHVDMTSFDREIIAKVSERRGLRGVKVLHPSAMYALFDPFWFQRTPITLVEAFTSFRRCRRWSSVAPGASARPVRGGEVLRKHGAA